MTLTNLITSLNIFEKYFAPRKQQFLSARQDELEITVTDFPVSEADVLSLIDLGWTQPEANPLTVETYDPEDFWRAFL